MSIPFSIVTVDGETAGVLLLREPASWLVEAAAALRLPVVAALWPDGYGFRLRCVAGGAEVPFSEVALAAAAHAVFEAELVAPDAPLPVLTDAGWREARRERRGRTLVRGQLAWPP